MVAVALAGCEQKVSATVYLRDVQQLLSSAAPAEIPVEIKIDVYETSIEQECQKSSGQKILEAVAAHFEKATLLGCEKIAASMNGRMSIKATTRLAVPEREDAPIKYLIELQAGKRPDENVDPISLRFDPQKYAKLQDDLKRISMMSNIKLSDTRVSIAVNNDTGNPVPVFFIPGSFVDGEAIDNRNDRDLQPREEAIIELGNVKTAFLGKNGWAFLLGWKYQNC
ncbi:DUF7424 family protein [Agrobacterium sp. El2ro-1b]|uniref:DUF7424 family protein n=1 Tax=Agrobacterium sp. El2ro-1b TaxID=2969528 RepID=UPI003AACC65A